MGRLWIWGDREVCYSGNYGAQLSWVGNGQAIQTTLMDGHILHGVEVCVVMPELSGYLHKLKPDDRSPLV